MLAVGPFGLGPFELVLILAIVVLIFGVGKMSDVGGALGKSIREFRKASRDSEDEEPSPPAVSQSSASSDPESSTTRACTKCGNQLDMETKFCAECGTPVQAAVN